jgi:hypothetical protein
MPYVLYRCLGETQKARSEENNKAISWYSNGRGQHPSFYCPQSRKKVGVKITDVKWQTNEASFTEARNAKYWLRLQSTIHDKKTQKTQNIDWIHRDVMWFFLSSGKYELSDSIINLGTKEPQKSRYRKLDWTSDDVWSFVVCRPNGMSAP